MQQQCQQQAFDNMQSNKYAITCKIDKRETTCKDGLACNNMQTTKYATTCNVTSMQQHAKMDLNQNGQISAIPKSVAKMMN